MNLSPIRFVYGFLGAVVGLSSYCAAREIWGSFYGTNFGFGQHLNIKAVIIVTAVSFFISFLWWEQIINFITKNRIKKDQNE